MRYSLHFACLLLVLGWSVAEAGDPTFTDPQARIYTHSEHQNSPPSFGSRASLEAKTGKSAAVGGTSATEKDTASTSWPMAVAVSSAPTSAARIEAHADLYVSTQPFEDFLARTEAGAHRWSAVAIAAATANNIPPELFLRLLAQESAFNPTAISKAGALGIAQFMPGTAIAVGLGDPFEPIAAINAAAKHLSRLRARFGNFGLAAAAYNAGPDRVLTWLSGRKALPQETAAYVWRVTGASAESWAVSNNNINVVVPRISRTTAIKAHVSPKRKARIISAAELCQAINANGSRCTVQRSY
jgi:soluble lytic murein transglycosylase-like protein